MLIRSRPTAADITIILLPLLLALSIVLNQKGIQTQTGSQVGVVFQVKVGLIQLSLANTTEEINAVRFVSQLLLGTVNISGSED